MFGKLGAIWDLFRKGQAVENPEAWKKGQVTVTVLAPVILAAAHLTETFGLGIKVDPDSATAIAGGIIAIVNVVLTFTTTDKIGILPAKSDASDGQSQPTSGYPTSPG